MWINFAKNFTKTRCVFHVEEMKIDVFGLILRALGGQNGLILRQF